jgi:PPOX class probable F420-dependent enzyme
MLTLFNFILPHNNTNPSKTKNRKQRKVTSMHKHEEHMNTEQQNFESLKVSDVAFLTTFRRNGQGVGTPVGIKVVEGKVYITTWHTTGKVKRLARNPRVTLAPFTKMGMKVIGGPVEGIARRLDEAETKTMAETALKQNWWGKMWNLLYRLRGWQSITYEVTPAR